MSSDSSELHPAQHRPGLPAPTTPIATTPAPLPSSSSSGTFEQESAPYDGRYLPAWTSHPWTGRHRDLRLLRRAARWQRRVAAFTALGYFAFFLALTVEVPSIMTRTAPGGLPTGLLLALAQLPVTWLAVLLYEFTARRYVDPLANRVRRQPHRPRDGERRP
ncbi:DUF485 domain-containing protein [Streptomyces sp. NPDC005423]|uniref:DUF485 domain-containing protein n=1 Tax=Streptomyces sp. NPDC005423 TaxID=3155343 RepID=UPI0033B6DCF3